MNTSSVISVAASLYKLVEAGEWGYAVAASNVSNRALKALFKSYAQQRFKFKEEIFGELQRLGGQTRPRSSFLGVIHRGRINIFTALTIGAENMEKTVLKEIMVGERVALRAYKMALKKDLPLQTRAIIEHQFQEVLKTVNEIQRMRGHNGKRLLVRLYDSKQDAENTLLTLSKTGVAINSVDMKDSSAITDGDLYDQDGRGNATISETTISGAAGGATWGVVAGVLAVIGILQISVFNLETITPLIPIVAFLGLIAGGIFIGSIIGLFIGWGISSEDEYVSGNLKQGEILMRVIVEESRASAVWKIMNQLAAQARAQRVSEPST